MPVPLRDDEYEIPKHVDRALYDLTDPKEEADFDEVCARYGIEPKYIEAVLRTRVGIARQNQYSETHIQSSFPVFVKALHDRVTRGEIKALELYARIMGIDKLRVDITGPEATLEIIEGRIRKILQVAGEVKKNDGGILEAEYTESSAADGDSA